jgi:hypothetical protein
MEASCDGHLFRFSPVAHDGRRGLAGGHQLSPRESGHVHNEVHRWAGESVTVVITVVVVVGLGRQGHAVSEHEPAFGVGVVDFHLRKK